jgi:uncharacterized protein (AIM24 family)
MNAHEIDYDIYGEEMQFVEIELDPYETVIAEAGAFMMMDQDIELKTIFGDGSRQEESKGIWGKVLSAGKRLKGEVLRIDRDATILPSFVGPMLGCFSRLRRDGC